MQGGPLRPVALTSVLCKCMEKVAAGELTTKVAEYLDLLQFAYKPKRGVEDTSLTLLEIATRHLDLLNSLVWILFMDFTSAFNTVNIGLLLESIQRLWVDTSLVLWIKDFFKDRPKHVGLWGFNSNSITVNTGVPQGFVLSPILFSIYTNEIKCDISGMSLLKYADDMALVAYMRDEQSLVTHRQFVDYMVLWFQESSLELNISKTKELCCGRLRLSNSEHPLSEPIKLGDMYLGTEIDRNLSFTQQVNSVYKKGLSGRFRSTCLRSRQWGKICPRAPQTVVGGVGVVGDRKSSASEAAVNNTSSSLKEMVLRASGLGNI